MEVSLNRINAKKQIKESYGKLVYSHTCHIKCAQYLKKKSSILKFLTIIISAISTCGLIGVIINWNTKLCGIVSVCLTTLNLIISTYLKASDIDEKVISHMDTAHKLWLLREKYISLLTDFEILSDKEIRRYRDEYTAELSNIYSSELLTDNKSYMKAQKALKSEEEQYFTNNELNKILPEHLRE